MALAKRKLSSDHLDRFVCSANEVIYFKFALKEEDVDNDDIAFRPEYTHQFFGESENIFGYVGLQVNLIYSACHLSPFFSMTFREKAKLSSTGGIDADNVCKIISDKQELEPQTDLDVFIESLNRESSFKPHGELLGTFDIKNDGSKETYGVYHASNSTPGFLGYHQRMQTLILWFIDAASYIDQEDDRWDYFILHQHVEEDGKEYFPFVGYATVYRYYAYPVKVRPRISQMLVMPMYQKRGVGSRLLESICDCYAKDTEVLDITVEDPSEEFIRIRDYIDCKRCQDLPSFSKDNLDKGFNDSMSEEARERFKINKRQSRRVYEILRLKSTNLQSVTDYRAYRLDVKNRLNVPYQREKMDMEKLQQNLSEEELNAAATPMADDKRIELLDRMYQELEKKYMHIIERLKKESH